MTLKSIYSSANLWVHIHKKCLVIVWKWMNIYSPFCALIYKCNHIWENSWQGRCWNPALPSFSWFCYIFIMVDFVSILPTPSLSLFLPWVLIPQITLEWACHSSIYCSFDRDYFIQPRMYFNNKIASLRKLEQGVFGPTTVCSLSCTTAFASRVGTELNLTVHLSDD